MRGQRPAGQEVHLERAHEPLQIARLDPRRRLADRRARSIRCRHVDAAPLGDRLEPRAQRRVAPGPGKQAARQRAVVEAGAADENRQPAARVDVADHRRRVARVLRRGVLVGRIDDVDQVMRDAAPLGDRHLVGADVEAAIDGGRIAVDDLAAEALGERQRQRALAGRGRPEDGDDERRSPHANDRRTTMNDEQQHHQTELLRPGHRGGISL